MRSRTRARPSKRRARGIACVCLSVGSDAEAERLEKVYGATNYLAIRRIEQMTTRLRRLMEGALAGAIKAA
jgi:nitric oxide reductase NorD protein